MKTLLCGQREQVAPGAVTSDLLSVCKMGPRVRVLFVFGLESEGGGGRNGKREERHVYFRAESHPVKLHSEVQ